MTFGASPTTSKETACRSELVFQDGHGEGLLGFQSPGGAVAWLPLFLFVILFGLSMDNHAGPSTPE